MKPEGRSPRFKCPDRCCRVSGKCTSVQYVTSREFRKLNFLVIETGTHDLYVRLVHLPLTRQGHVFALKPWASPFGLHPRLKASVRYAAETPPAPLLTWRQWRGSPPLFEARLSNAPRYCKLYLVDTLA